MEPIEFITPSKYKVLLKPQLTYGEYKQIKEVVKQQMFVEFKKPKQGEELNEENMKFQPVSIAALTSANDIALRFLLVKVFDSQGNDQGDPLKAIDNMPPVDGDAVMDKIDEITTAAEPPAKKNETK